MLFSFLVTLREGIEIALVVTILLGYLRNINQKRHFREIWAGVIAAAALAVAFTLVLELTSKELDGRVLETFEGSAMIFAVVVLTWMVFWMKRQSAGISRDLRHRIDTALHSGSVLALALLAFTAVGREGIETSLFLFAGSTNASSGFQFWGGGALGFAIAGAAGVVIYYGAARLPLRQFFLVSGVVVIILAAGLLSNGLAALQAAGVIDTLGTRPWDTEATISMSSSFGKFLNTVLGYDSAPAVWQIIPYWAYVTVVAGAYVFAPSGKPPRPRVSESGAAPASTATPANT
ncbi:MAG: FTR1 family protein [Chloroflexi bacterium]|nr:FTR1 family protein [Chloroflexota bacterium]